MIEASRRAARKPARGGLPNALFVVAAAESLPFELEGAFDEVTVHFPWGSLLRGVTNADGSILCGFSRVLKAGGSLHILLSITDREASAGLEPLTAKRLDWLRGAYATHGLGLIDARRADEATIAASHSTWAKRLGREREVWSLLFRRCE